MIGVGAGGGNSVNIKGTAGWGRIRVNCVVTENRKKKKLPQTLECVGKFTKSEKAFPTINHGAKKKWYVVALSKNLGH